MESRTQGSRPRTQKNPKPRPRTAFSRTDTLKAKRPRTKDTSASALQKKKKKDLHINFSGDLKKKKKKKVFTKIFQAISTEKRFPKNFSSVPQNFNNSNSLVVSLLLTEAVLDFWDFKLLILVKRI